MAVSLCGKRIVLTRTCLFKTTKRKLGYVILLPEIGEDLPEKNPLLKENGLPEFNTFTVERSIAAIGRQTVEFEQGIKNIEDTLDASENVNIINDVLLPMEELNVPLETTWGIAKALYFGNQSLMPTKYFESIQNRMNNTKSTKFTSVPIYKACKDTLQKNDSNLNDGQRRTLMKLVFGSRMNGLDLNEKAKKKFDFSTFKLANKKKEVHFKLQHTKGLFQHTITNPNIVKDFPKDYLKMIAVDPANPQEGPWKITLQPHIATPFMELCPSREVRWNVWQADVGKSGPQMESEIRTSKPIEDIRDHHIIQAKLLGYESYSHMSMETKMAKSLDHVYQFLETLLNVARPAQEQEFIELTEFARERGFDGDLQEWDVDYWARKHRRSVLNLKYEFLRDYFPLPVVLKGLFELVERLFDIRIVETRKTDVWHADVRFFDIIDLKGSNDEPISSFYLDPYARRDSGLRMEKDSGWMVSMRNRSVHTSTNPLVALVFNFQPPTNDKPSLLSFKDVAVLFQEFGFALQTLLTKAELYEVSGSSNVEMDAIGISGQFLANWLYEPSVIRQVSSHYKTSEPLPPETIDTLKNVRSHMAGYRLCKDLYFSKFDLKLFELDIFWLDLMKPLWEEHFVIPQSPINYHVSSWESIFIGGWAASYYSTLWSEMVAADAYSAFQEIPPGDKDLEKETASRFRETFLSLGGVYPASEVFRRFRGRDPSPNAMVKNLGLEQRKQIEGVE